MNNIRFRLAIILLVLLAFTCSDLGLTGQMMNISRASACYSLVSQYRVVNPDLKSKAEGVVLDIALPKSQEKDKCEYSSLVSLETNPLPDQILSDDKGNRRAKFRLDTLSPGEEKLITITSIYRLKSVNYNLGSLSLEAGEQNLPSEMKIYLQPSPGIESDHPEIIAAAKKVIEAKSDQLEKTKAVYSFVCTHLNYKLGENANQGALNALRTREGVCDDYASLMVALLRASGVPARHLAGEEIRDREEYDERFLTPGGGIILRSEDGRYYPGHAWAEFYLSGQGWIPADPASYLVQNEKRRVNPFGFGSLGKRRVLLTGVDRENKDNYRVSWRGSAELNVFNQLVVYEQPES